MVPEKVKAELKRFLSDKQVEELTRQVGTYEKRVRSAVKHFDVKGRQARELGQERLDQFATQVKRTREQLEKQVKAFVASESRQLNKGLNELFTYFRGLSKQPARKASGKKRPAPKKQAARKPRPSATKRSSVSAAESQASSVN